MIHTDIDLLVPAMRNIFWSFKTLCDESELLKKLGLSLVVIETGRDLVVQMAYAVRGRLIARPEDKKTSIQWVKDFYRKAGLGDISNADATNPATWTLDSKHIEGKAFDAWLSKDGISPYWNAPAEACEEMYKLARSVGLSCGHDWPEKDNDHFEIA